MRRFAAFHAGDLLFFAAKHRARLPRHDRRFCFTCEMERFAGKITTTDFCCSHTRGFNGFNPQLPRFPACPPAILPSAGNLTAKRAINANASNRYVLKFNCQQFGTQFNFSRDSAFTLQQVFCLFSVTF